MVCCECSGYGFEPRVRNADGDVDLVDCRHCRGTGVCADPIVKDQLILDLKW